MNLPRPQKVTPFNEPTLFNREPFFEDYPTDDPSAYHTEPAFLNEPHFPSMNSEPKEEPFQYREPVEEPFFNAGPIVHKNAFHNGGPIHSSPFHHGIDNLRSNLEQMKNSFRDYHIRKRFERQVPYSYFPYYT